MGIMQAGETLVLGMGNPILSDDAVGIRLARECQVRAGERPHVHYVVDCSVGGLELLDVIQGYDRLIVFDAIKGGGGPPGTWYRMTGESFSETLNLTNIHDANFTTALELGRLLGAHIPRPENIHIFAVEIIDNITFSEQMTPLLESRYPRIADEILAQALALLDEPICISPEASHL